MNKFFLLVLISTISFVSANSQDKIFFISPGFKLGYIFGKSGGFVWGLELSILKVPFNYGKGIAGDIYGIVFDVDVCKRVTKFHLGVEYINLNYWGVSLGPTMFSDRGDKDYGINITPFGGYGFYPYFGYTYRFTRPDIYEIGSYLKMPIPVNLNFDKL